MQCLVTFTFQGNEKDRSSFQQNCKQICLPRVATTSFIKVFPLCIEVFNRLFSLSAIDISVVSLKGPDNPSQNPLY